MNIQVISIERMLSTLAFFLLFPGFYFYNFLIAQSIIPPFLGGYFGIVSLLLLPLLLLPFVFSSIREVSQLEVIFICLLIYILLVSVINFVDLKPLGFANELLTWSVSGVLINMLTYLVARNITFSSFYIKLIFVTFLIMFALIISNIGDSGIFYMKQDSEESQKFVATYQGFARSLVFVLLPLAAYYFKSTKVLIFIIFLGAMALFFNGARTEFILFILSLLALLLFYSLLNVKFFIFTLFIGCTLIVIATNLVYLFPESRMLQLFNITASTSYQSRGLLLDFNIDLIANNFLIGNYGGYTAIGGVGSYAHNLLSAWVNLGFLGFVTYLYILFVLWVETLDKLKGGEGDNPLFRMQILFLIFVTIAFLFSKNYSYMLFGFVVGLFANNNNNNNNSRLKND